jgi:hypothetical protein
LYTWVQGTATILDAFEFYLSKPVASSKSDRRLAKNLLFITRTHQNKQEREMEQKFCFVQGSAYKQKQITFKKPMTSICRTRSPVAKNYYLLQQHTKTSEKGKWSKSFVLCRALLTNRSRKLLKSQ